MKLFYFLALICSSFYSSTYAIGVQKDLNLITCKIGDSISKTTRNGQGKDRLKIVKKLEAGVCRVEYETEIEMGYTRYLCEFGPDRVSLDFSNLQMEKCKKQKSGSYIMDTIEERKNAQPRE